MFIISKSFAKITPNPSFFHYTEEEEKKMTSELEEQFSHGLDNKLSGAARRHKGLGFHSEATSSGDPAKAAEPSSEAQEKAAETSSDDKTSESQTQECERTDAKEDSSKVAPDSTSGDSSKKLPDGVKMMQFVKSSS